MKKILLSLITICILSLGAYAQDKGVIVNEVSNGQSTSKEFVELLVVGCPGDKVDLRGWILDDNNGDFGSGTGMGIAKGHIRFTNITEWSAIPVGSLILIYNTNDKNLSITDKDDPTDVNDDFLYVFNLSLENGKYFEKNTTKPSSSDDTYPSNAYSPVTPSGTSWAPIALSNKQDVMQVRKPDLSFFHGVGYALTGISRGIIISGSGAKKTIPFSDGSYIDDSNFDKISANLQTPGKFNNNKNKAYIDFLRTVTNAGKDNAVCNTLKYTMKGSGTEALWTTMWTFKTTGQWTKVSGPGTATFTDPTSPTSEVTVSLAGTYEFQWAQNTATCKKSDNVTITFTPAVTATATAPKSVCGFQIKLTGGNTPTPVLTSGKWTTAAKPSGAGNPTFVNDTKNITTATVDKVGTYTFKWTLAGTTTCASSKTATIDVTKGPIVTITPKAGITCDLTKELTGSLPSKTATGVWTSSTPSVTFTPNATTATATARVPSSGEHEFTWTVTDGACKSQADKKVTFIKFDKPTIATKETQFCGKSATLEGQALPKGFTGQWTATPSASVTFTNPTQPSTTVNVPNLGDYEFVWTISKGGCSESSLAHKATFSKTLTVSIEGPTEVCALKTTLKATNSKGKWTSKPTGATFKNEEDPTSDVSVPTAGSYEFTWTVAANRSCPKAEATQTINFYDPIPVPTVDDIEIKANAEGQLTIEYTSGTEPAGATYLWEPAEGLDNNTLKNPMASPKKTTEYTVTITSLGSCQASTKATVTVTTTLLVIPQVFSPNEDAVNDLWVIQNTDPFPNMTVKVYNRWGNIVFQSTNGYKQPWDGTYNGNKVPTGTYYYVIDPNDDSSQAKPVKGSISVTY